MFKLVPLDHVDIHISNAVVTNFDIEFFFIFYVNATVINYIIENYFKLKS